MASIGGQTLVEAFTNFFQTSNTFDFFDGSSSSSDNIISDSDVIYDIAQLEEVPPFFKQELEDSLTYFEINKLFVGWREKLPHDWTSDDVLDWLCTVDCYKQNGTSNVKVESFKDVDGQQLCKLTRNDFLERDPNNGLRIYSTLMDLINDYQVFTFIELNGGENQMNTNRENGSMTLPNISSFIGPCSSDVEFHIYDTSTTSPPPTPTNIHSIIERGHTLSSIPDFDNMTNKTRKKSHKNSDKKHFVKRPKKTKATHLWKFMRSLLDDPTYNPAYIRWEDKDKGVFRIVPGQSKNIAKLWGMKKNNPTMTFDKLSRSLRWCREYGFLSKVPSNEGFPKKLCFRFGDRAMDWNGN